ncbi:TonB-dependent receptor [Desertivirga brevis]|uniref:TonB-dependent receptor n=1 Tax=Desertivirga brevis TaxID=2810310 RepID=UPI001A97C118|nr:TonB-dependent receptor [Pedobacter sp. SYSU D00873]
MRTIIFACLMHLTCFLYAQKQNVMVRIVDSRSQTALQGADIRSIGNGSIISQSNAQGRSTVSLNDSIEVSKPGYNTIRVLAVEGLVVSLEATSNFLSEVVVSGSREQQSRKEIPAAISKINSATLTETRATALYQLLNKSAGVYMVNLGNEQHTMAIRQPITYNALYLYLEDGLPIRPTGIFNHNALYEINMNGLKGIEVIKGPASSLYGSNAIGGSINFITANPPIGQQAQLSVQGDGYNYYRTDISTGLTRGKLGVYVGAYTARQKNSWQDYTDFDKYSASLKTTYDFNSASRLTVAGSFSYLDTQTPGSLDSARFYSRRYSSNQRFTYRKVNALRLSARIDHRWNSSNSTFLTAFFRDNSTGQLPSYFIGDSIAKDTKKYVLSRGQENNLSFKSFGLLTQHSSQIKFLNSKFQIGAYLDYSPSTFYANYLSINKDVPSNFYTGFNKTDSVIDNYKTNLVNAATFAQLQVNPIKALRVVAGLRYDNLIYNFENKLPLGKTKYKQNEKNVYSVLAPKLGLTYDFGKGFGVYSNWSVGFQPPETSFLYSARQTNILEQATFQNYELGAWLPVHEKLNIELAAFAMNGKNEIITVMMPDNTTQNDNAGATRHRGIEYTLVYTPTKQLGLRFGGTYAEHKYQEYSELLFGKTVFYNGNSMANAPASIINSEVTWKPGFVAGLRMAAEWQSISKYYVNSANTRSYRGYDIFNLRFGYDIKAKVAKGAGLWLNIMNVTDQLYANNVTGNQYGVTYNAAAPRTVTIGLTYSFTHLK